MKVLSVCFAGLFLALPPSGAFAVAAGGWTNRYLLDQQGRQIVPGGFVVVEGVSYTPDDYRRMVRMGANFQVIRMPIGVIGGLPGSTADAGYLARFDAMVRMGKDAGLRTVFKLVFYGQPFGEVQWDALWKNTDGRQDILKAAWSRIWARYRKEPAVFGYDLLNEPQRGIDADYDRCQRERLLPLLRSLTDAMHEISPEKWALYQPLLRKPEDQWAPGRNPVVTIEEPFGRERVIFAPHLYQMDPSLIAPMLDDFERQATISNVPLLVGEWGPPTRATTEGNPTEQAAYSRIYQVTVNELDARGIGGIKAWFRGTRKPVPVTGSTNWMTWAIFSDPSPAGKVERRYITDVIARARPLVVAGRITGCGNDFDAREFAMTLNTDPALGATEIFVPAERCYAAGFRVEVGAGLTLGHAPGAATLRIVQADDAAGKEQAKWVRWDAPAQQLIIDRWVGEARRLKLRILPEAN